MQPRVLPIRGDLTAAQVEALIKTDPSIIVGCGMELLDRDLNVLADITQYLRTCTVTHENANTLHNVAQFTISTPLTWGRAVVRPFVTISNGVQKARFNMGAYFTSTPATITDEVPATYSVAGTDILNALNTLVGDSYSIMVGDNYLDAVESILTNLGYSQYIIDPVRLTTTAPAAKGWPLDENTTWLMIVNELLKAIGYAPIYSDQDGRLVCEQLRDDATRAPEWTYTRGQFDGQLVPGQEIVRDYFSTPNRWVGIQGTPAEGVTPTEGNGVYTYVNTNDGDTSVSARDQLITRVLTLTAADQAALVAAVMAEVAKDKQVGTNVTATTSINPLHWHQDIVSFESLEIGNVRVKAISWSMDLLTGAMNHRWAVL